MEIENKKRITDYLNICFKWKTFILINLIVLISLITFYAFSIPEKFKSTATIMMPPESGLSGLTSLMSAGKSSANIGAKLFGLGGNTSEDMILGILNSRSAFEKIITQYNLMGYYEIDDNNMDKAIKSFRADVMFNPNEFGMIDVSVLNKSPKLSHDIVNFFLMLGDSLTLELNRQNALNNREFIEKRYQQSIDELKSAEDALYKFQKKFKIFAIPEQFTASIKAAAEIESKLAENEILQNLYKETYGTESPEYKRALSQTEYFRKKVSELKNSNSLSTESNVLVPFSNIPDIYIEYVKIYRELEKQSKILEIVVPMYEQAKAEEGKTIPSFLIVDKASIPVLKDEPKRAFIIISLGFAAFVFLLLCVFILEYYVRVSTPMNDLDSRLKTIAHNINRLYRVRQ